MTDTPNDSERQRVPQAVHDCINDVWQEVVPLIGAQLGAGHNLADLTLVVEGQIPPEQQEALRARHYVVRGTTAGGVAMRTAAAEGLLRENPSAAERVGTRLPDDHLYLVVLLGGNCYVLTPKFGPGAFPAPPRAAPRPPQAELLQVIRAHFDAAWPAIRHSLRAGLDNGHRLADLAVFLTDHYDDELAEKARAKGGFVDPPTIAAVFFRTQVQALARGAGPEHAAALAKEPPPGGVWMFTFTVFGPAVTLLRYDPDAPLPSFGDA